jgi:hypothetical protein
MEDWKLAITNVNNMRLIDWIEVYKSTRTPSTGK